MDAKGHTVVIVNPHAAGGRTGRSWAKLAPILRESYGELEDCYTEGPGDGTLLTQQALREGASTIIAVGGDGSVNEVVNGFFDENGPIAAQAAFGVLPLGTGGDFIRSIGMPRDPVLAARALSTSTPRAIDVGRLSYIDHAGAPASRYFVNVASFGIAGLVDKYVNRSQKRLGGTVTFALSTIRAGIAYSNSEVRLRVDDGPWRIGPIYNVSVANGCFFGGGMKVAPDALLDDGYFEMVRFGDFGVADLLRHGLDLYTGKHLSLEEVSTARVRSLEAESLDSSEVLLDVDGEQPGRLPARFEIVPSAIRLLSPELPS